MAPDYIISSKVILVIQIDAVKLMRSSVTPLPCTDKNLGYTYIHTYVLLYLTETVHVFCLSLWHLCT